jgi:hypothetical protein
MVLGSVGVLVLIGCTSGESPKTKAAFAEIEALTTRLRMTGLGQVVTDTSYGALKLSSDPPTRVLVVTTPSPQGARDALNQRLAEAGWRQRGSCPADGPCTFEGDSDGHVMTVTSVILAPGTSYPVRDARHTLPAGSPGLLIRTVANS